MKATIVSNKGNINVDDANIVLLPDGSLVLCYPIPNLNGSTDYHIGDIVINNGCFFESKSSLSYQELSLIMTKSSCKKITFENITVFLLNDVLEKKQAYKAYMEYLKNEISNNRKKINDLSNQTSYTKTVATAHEDNGNLVLILYKYDSDQIEAIKFKDEEQDNYLYLKNLKRVHMVKIPNTTLLKYSADLVTKKEAGELEIYHDKDNNEYCIEYLVINYVVQKVTYTKDSTRARSILSDDYIYLSKMNKDRKLKYKYHYKKNKSLFIGFNTNIRIDSPDNDDELLLFNNSSFYKNINE